MSLPVTRLRRWFAAAAILMIAIVAGMYFYARWRVRGAIHEVPAKVGLDIQQTAEGFSISKSEQGRTEFTVSASKAVQFKEGGRAELHNVKIVVYGKDSSRFDRIAGDDFEFDPKSGEITAKGRVLIDLEANPEGINKADQAPPTETGKPIHVESDGLTFNKDTGNGFTTGKVTFETPEASGSAVGINYVAKTGTMTLRSSVEMDVHQPHQFHLKAEHGVITKGPTEIVLDAVHLTRHNQQLQSDRATFFLRNDNTVERILAEGDVEGGVRAASVTHARSDRAELLLTGTRNQLTAAFLSGSVHLETNGASTAQGDAGRATLYFGANQVLEKVHAEDGVRLIQNQSAQGFASRSAQQVEMTAPVMDFVLKKGNQLESAETSGPHCDHAAGHKTEDGRHRRPVHSQIHCKESSGCPARRAGCQDRRQHSRPTRSNLNQPNPRCSIRSRRRNFHHHAGGRSHLRERNAEGLGAERHLYCCRPDAGAEWISPRRGWRDDHNRPEDQL